MSQTSFQRLLVIPTLLVSVGCPSAKGGDSAASGETMTTSGGTSGSGGSSSQSSSFGTAGTGGESSSATEALSTTGTDSGGGSSSGGMDPADICRAASPNPSCPYLDALPGNSRCRDVDVYIYDSPDECQPPLETRCEVLQSDITGGSTHCASPDFNPRTGQYMEGWFREIDGGQIEFWGVRWVGDNPPAAPGFASCLDIPTMCVCECDFIQPQ